MRIKESIYTTSATTVGGRNGHVKSENGNIDMERANPEELFAAGYSACFNGALNLAALKNKIRTESEVTITVTLGKDEQGNFQLAAKVDAVVPGVSDEVAQKLVEQAHTICPYSRAVSASIDVELNGRGR